MSPFIFKIPPVLGYSEVTKLLASDGLSGDQFAESVSIDGTTLVIGARLSDPGGTVNQGAAYVFEDTGSAWVQVKKLIASDGAASDAFGTSVGISGAIIVIGVRTADPGGTSNQGAAYVFEKSGTWPGTETKKLLASDGALNDFFGTSVGISGTTIVVSATGDDTGGNNKGTAYVFEKSGTWPATETKKLLPSDGEAYDSFGSSVSIDGTTIVIGAKFSNPGGIYDQGSAYVFEKSGTWPATETKKLLASDGAQDDWFGYSVSISGGIIVVSAMMADPGGNSNQGAAYVFEKSGTWPSTETQKLLASDGAPDDRMGISVSISGTTIIIGVHYSDPGGNGNQGAAYVFEKSGTWPATETQKLVASDGATGDNFGRAVSISGTAIVVGANPSVNSNVGGAYTYKK